MPLATIPIDKIDVGQRLREASAEQVIALGNSIGDVGLLNPITVYPRRVLHGGIFVDGYGLIAGAHRLAACKNLGHTEIAAQIVELSDLERQIAECDENLFSTKLTKAERALFTKRRKEAYEALHPETKNAAFHGNQHKGGVRQLGEVHAADRFTADTAAKTGQSERAVQRDAERGAKIGDDVLEQVKGTKLDTGTYLDKLKAVPAKKQAEKVRADLAAPTSGIARRFAGAAPTPVSRHSLQVSDLMKAWGAAEEPARAEFLKKIGRAA